MNIFGIFLILLVISLILMAIRAINNAMTISRLNEEGIIVYGVIEDKQLIRTRRGSWNSLVLRYECEGVEYTQKLNVKKRRYDELAAGDRIALSCLPAFPKMIRLAEDLDRL
jgi:hypothetical protein